MRIVSLMTDFGTGDFKIGSMSGVILSLAPETKLVDLTHDIPPHDVLDAAVILSRYFYYFPPYSIHVVVVDPGVEISPRAIAASIKDQIFVGPDNGIITIVYQEAIKNQWPIRIVHTNQQEFWMPDVSHIIHGRDVFAAIAGHLSSGIDIQDLGKEISNPVLLDLPEPVISSREIHGIVMRVDHFGNLETNIDQALVKQYDKILIKCNSYIIDGLVDTFGNAKEGDLVAMIDSSGQLSICVVNGSAKKILNAGFGTLVDIFIHDL